MSYNSTIISKKKNLKCGHFDFNFSKGRCKMCASIDSAKKRKALAREIPQIKKLDNKLLDGKARDEFEKIQQFFKAAAKIIATKPYCAECGTFIPERYYRAATAHCLPKRAVYGFPSIAANIDNFLILGSGCGCHQKYDSTWEQAAQMRVFPIAVTKFLNLYPLIAKEERKNIPDVLLQYLEPTE